MARLVFNQAIIKQDNECLADLRSIVKEKDFIPTKFQDIVNKILVTGYLGTVNSSSETKNRAKKLADSISSYHLDVTIDEVT